MKTQLCTVYLLVDEEGNYVATEDSEQIGDRYDEVVGNGAEMPRRIVELQVEVPLPVAVVLTDWGTPWTEYRISAADEQTLLAYARCFCFEV